MKISIIIPTYNEESTLELLLKDLAQNHHSHETIIVDGGSTDKTIAIAKKYTKNVYVSNKKGRACQMNFGAMHAKGDVYLFLHADTFLPTNAFAEIEIALSSKNCGRFRNSFQPSSILLNFYAFFTRFHYFSYGDQAFFVTPKLFNAVGKYNEQISFEDIDFYCKIRHIEKPYISPKSVSTSARRFTKVGIVKQAAIDFLFIIMIQCKFSSTWIQKIKKWLYPDIR